MKIAIAILIAVSVSACGFDPGRQGEAFNAKDLFQKLERQSGGSTP